MREGLKYETTSLKRVKWLTSESYHHKKVGFLQGHITIHNMICITRQKLCFWLPKKTSKLAHS